MEKTKARKLKKIVIAVNLGLLIIVVINLLIFYL